MGVSPAAEWEELYNRFYRKQEVYEMAWPDVDLSLHIVACARAGGPIAIIRDDSKLVLLGAGSIRPEVRVFTASGKQLCSFIWDRGRLVALGWSNADTLLCVQDDGTVFRYNVFGQLLQPSQFSLGRECKDQRVVQCHIWSSGLVARTAANQLVAITSLDEPRPQLLADPGFQDEPACMAVLEPRFTLSNAVEVMLAVGDTIYEVDAAGVTPHPLRAGIISRMVFSMLGKFLACFTQDGKLLVLSADLGQIISEHNTQTLLPPDVLLWCAEDSVVLYWSEEQRLLMVGPTGAQLEWQYTEPLCLAPECDGLRIITNNRTEFLQRVPDATVDVFSIGSTTPAAMLYDAMEHFDHRSAKADENIRTIGSKLSEAVAACVDAAGFELDIPTQRSLLRAAAYGKAFCPSFSRDRFFNTCQTLRILNAVRHYDAGIAITYQQYQMLTPEVLIKRLISHHHHLLALRVSEYLGFGQKRVLQHWACAKIAATSGAGVPDSLVLELLVSKLKACQGISYASIAMDAFSNGRPKLAAMLLDYEPRAAEQVPLLMKMGELERAIVKAIESGDTDLVYYIIFHIWEKEPQDVFFRLVQSKPLARDLFIAYTKHVDVDLLKKFYLATGQTENVAALTLAASFALGPSLRAGSASNRQVRGLAAIAKDLGREDVARIKLMEKSIELYAQSKEHAFQARSIDDAIRLLRVQKELETSTGQRVFMDSSVSDTIRTCLVMGNHKAAQRVRSEMKVPDKAWYWLKTKALANIKDWDSLRKFAAERKPPVGYMPFVEVCIDEQHPVEAAYYINKLPDLHDRAQLLARIGMYAEAAEAAAQAKDGELLSRLRASLPGNSTAVALIDKLKDKLTLQT
eukprot:jgi/Chlat1/7715/Chrsp66S07190